MGRTGRNGIRIAGRYRLVEKLGTGGMSVVWRGYDETLGRSVAVKVLSPRHADDLTFRDRLRQEALAAARLCHPHITGIFDFGEALLTERLTVPYVVMELNDGESVAARLSRKGPIAWRDAVTMATEVASALATAHARGLVHRDVTPANVMLTGAGAKVVDFGISAIVGQRDAAPDGSLLGTPAYLAPERLGGSQVAAATDVYALGLLLYRTLTGRLPWPAETTAEALRAHLYADPDPLPDLPGMPAEVAEVCLRCLTKNPDERPAAAEAARLLGAAVGVHPIIPPLRERRDDAPPPVRAAAAAVQPSSPGLLALLFSRSLRWSRSLRSSPPVSSPAESSPAGSSSAASLSPGSSTAESSTAESSSPGPSLPGPSSPGSLPLPHAASPVRSGLRLLRLRTGLRVGGLLRLGRAIRPLGGGLFASGGLGGLGALGLRGGRGSLRGLGGRGSLRGLGGRGSLRGLGGPSATGKRYRVQAAVVMAALLTAGGVGWASTRETPDGEQAQAAGPAPAAVVPARSASCAVRYQLQHDSGRDYEALLTVATTDEVGRSQWRVQFSYPGSQRLTGAPKAVSQKGRKVVAKGSGNLRSFTLRGAYSDYNPLPMAFTLDGRRCRAEVLGAIVAAEPAARDAQGRRDGPPRNSNTPQKRAGRAKQPPRLPPPALPSVPPASRKGSGFSLALR